MRKGNGGGTGRYDEHTWIKRTKQPILSINNIHFFSYKSPFIDFGDEE